MARRRCKTKVRCKNWAPIFHVIDIILAMAFMYVLYIQPTHMILSICRLFLFCFVRLIHGPRHRYLRLHNTPAQPCITTSAWKKREKRKLRVFICVFLFFFYFYYETFFSRKCKRHAHLCKRVRYRHGEIESENKE